MMEQEMSNAVTIKPAILRMPDVERLTGLSKSSVHRLVRAGSFPRPVPLGVSAVGYLCSEVERWIAERVRERDHGQVAA